MMSSVARILGSGVLVVAGVLAASGHFGELISISTVGTAQADIRVKGGTAIIDGHELDADEEAILQVVWNDGGTQRTTRIWRRRVHKDLVKHP